MWETTCCQFAIPSGVLHDLSASTDFGSIDISHTEYRRHIAALRNLKHRYVVIASGELSSKHARCLCSRSTSFALTPILTQVAESKLSICPSQHHPSSVSRSTFLHFPLPLLTTQHLNP